MYRFKSFYFTISLFFGLIFLFGGSVAFGQNNNCRTSTPDTTLHGTHFYTCEYNDEYSKKRLSDYCTKDGSTSTWPEYSGCPIAGKTQLKCHICECQNGKWIDGVCKKEEEKPQDPELTGSNTISATINSTNTENQQTEDTSNTTPCPSNILDSQGNCCKKTYYDLKLKATVCCEGILLSTNVPFIGQCIVYKKASDNQQPAAGLVVDENTAFPVLMGGLSKILVSIILLVSFVGILIGGVMISASGGSEEGAKKGRKIIGNVISALALLGASGVILKLINPNFFG